MKEQNHVPVLVRCFSALIQMIGYLMHIYRVIKELRHNQSIFINNGFPTVKFVKPKRAHHNNQVYQRERENNENKDN